MTKLELGRERHIKLDRLGLRRQDLKLVLANDQGKASAVVPFHMKLPYIIDIFQSAYGSSSRMVSKYFWVSVKVCSSPLA